MSPIVIADEIHLLCCQTDNTAGLLQSRHQLMDGSKMELAIDSQGKVVSVFGEVSEYSTQELRCLICNQSVLYYSTDNKFIHTISDSQAPSVSCEDERAISLVLIRKFPFNLCRVCDNDHLTELKYEATEVVPESQLQSHWGCELGSKGIENVDVFIHNPMRDMVINLGSRRFTEDEFNALQEQHDVIWVLTSPESIIDCYMRQLKPDIFRPRPRDCRIDRARLFHADVYNLPCYMCDMMERQGEVRMFRKCYALLDPESHSDEHEKLRDAFKKIAAELRISI